MGGDNGHSSSPASSSNHDSPGTNVSSTLDLPIDSDGTDPCPPHDPDPWSCMHTIQLERDPCPPNKDDPWSCMESIQLDAEHNAHSNHRDANSAHHWHTHWIPWIDRNKDILRACTTQPWFNALKSEWKQHVRQHATDEVSGQRELGEAATLPMKKPRLWKAWVAQQHRQMCMHKEQWFQHLLNNVEEDTESQKGQAPIVEEDLEVEQLMAAADMLQVRDVPCTHLHQQLYMTKRLTAKTWILILALVIEDSELERTMQDRELYVDDLLEKL
ncbi:hypothetical protein AK88_00166 [Plasmodium fragile]|uniref:Schizont-infected cell agglutination C-terminal domain-containing protein n=1 Tax=Plasmodium fragile TaxID=5857 RepID=A0A0D9QTL2_PLAFR|nr:uncharacterized protein AK88_00166 [Plasmodium fragile]KJP90318.1 hypothetical protein AK88_00166 [Plasmodium fragile]